MNFDVSGSLDDLIQLNQCQASYFRAMADEEAFWKQKARIKWLKEGDRNSRFFHATIQERRVRLRVSQIKDATGQWLISETDIKSHVVDFF